MNAADDMAIGPTGGSRAFYSTLDGWVHAVEAKTGAILWETQIGTAAQTGAGGAPAGIFTAERPPSMEGTSTEAPSAALHAPRSIAAIGATCRIRAAFWKPPSELTWKLAARQAISSV